MRRSCVERECSGPVVGRDRCKKHYYRIYARENRDPVNERRFDFRRRYLKEWPREWNDRAVFEEVVGPLPGPGYRLRKRDHTKPLSADNLAWVPPLPVSVRPGDDMAQYHIETYRMRKYRLTPKEYDDLLCGQNGGCAICKADDGRLVVDHDHETNEVRGLLCDSCNSGLGRFGDDPAALAAAIVYLAR